MCMCWGNMCIVLIGPELWCLGASCVGCQHLLGYSTLCVCWFGVCGLFGILFCCIELCEGLLCVGGYRWRVGVAACRLCGFGKICIWGWDMLVAKRCSINGFPCIGRIGISRYVEFVHKILWGFPKMVWGFFINLCVAYPFVDVCKFGFCVVLVRSGICLSGGRGFHCGFCMPEFCWAIKVWCMRCVCGDAEVGLLQVVPLFASWSKILLLEILVCALTFCNIMCVWSI